MILQLTPEQQSAVGVMNGGPAKLQHPITGKLYRLLPEDEYAELLADAEYERVARGMAELAAQSMGKALAEDDE